MTLTDLQPLVDTRQLADAGNLSALKRAAAKNSPQALRAAAKQFESLFVSMVLKSMQKANFKDPLFGSSQGNLYQSMYDDQIAAEISKGKGLGLADMLVQQLRREQPGAAGSAGTATAAGTQAQGGTSTAAGLPAATPAPSATGAAAAPGAAAGISPTAPSGNAAPPAAAASTTPASASQPACATTAEQAGFARALWPDAQRAARELGVSPVTLLAQAALETNWGRSVPQASGGATSHNLFGIKATAGWSGPAVANRTQEYSGGLPATVTAQFRSYGSPSQCFQDYVSVLRGNPRYAAALGTGADVQAFGSALQQGGYATDPAYASKLTAVAGSLERALASQPAGSAAQGGSLKFAASLPTTLGGGTLQRR